MTGQNNNEGPLWLRKLKSNSIIAVLLFFVAVVTGLASFTDSLGKLARFFADEQQQESVDKKSSRDAKLEQAVLGKWRCNSKLPTLAGYTVVELYNIFLPGGLYNSRGTFQNAWGARYPIMVSGTWEIIDGNLHYEVTSSNVPLAIAEGYKSYTELISVENGKMTYIDSVDGNTKVDYLVE